MKTYKDKHAVSMHSIYTTIQIPYNVLCLDYLMHTGIFVLVPVNNTVLVTTS